MKNFIESIAIAAVILLLPSSLHAECDVQEVIEMVDDDMSTKMIKDACGSKVDVPDCSVSKVIRLARKGTTEDDIYKVCEDELTISNKVPKVERNTGLPRGSVVQTCGCWGFVNIGTTERKSECASGYGVVVMCYAYCLAGGVQWGIRCQ